MKNSFNKNKVTFIVTLATLVSAAASVTYTIWRLRRVREQHIISHITEKDFERIKGKEDNIE
ncbi:MAG: hypothetical protein HDR29_00025 [Lachnospiraceae bacterium]|nr:hypothetical protein [Lachnospiraceae bacterium]